MPLSHLYHTFNNANNNTFDVSVYAISITPGFWRPKIQFKNYNFFPLRGGSGNPGVDRAK